MRMRFQFTAALLLVLLLSKVGVSAKDEKAEPYNFFREYVGLNDDKIREISHGKATAKILDSGSADQVIVFGAVHIEASPES